MTEIDFEKHIGMLSNSAVSKSTAEINSEKFFEEVRSLISNLPETEKKAILLRLTPPVEKEAQTGEVGERPYFIPTRDPGKTIPNKDR